MTFKQAEGEGQRDRAIRQVENCAHEILIGEDGKEAGAAYYWARAHVKAFYGYRYLDLAPSHRILEERGWEFAQCTEETT